jgi:hypothetical protein
MEEHLDGMEAKLRSRRSDIGDLKEKLKWRFVLLCCTTVRTTRTSLIRQGLDITAIIFIVCRRSVNGK